MPHDMEMTGRTEPGMRLTLVEARDINEAWFKLLRECLLHGHEYRISAGSDGLEGRRRKEFDCAVIHIRQPGIRPLVPDVPSGVPSPTDMQHLEEYVASYLLCETKQENEIYTYGEYLESQFLDVISMYQRGGFNTNQACMMVGGKESIKQSDPPCLRIIDTRVRYGRLHWFIYFRSWDLWGGFPTNIGGIQLAKEMMAKELGVEDGEIFAFSKGLHLYDDAWEYARLVARLDAGAGEKAAGQSA
jgi:thymidylate synthase